MTKIERVVRELAELYEFQRRLEHWRRTEVTTPEFRNPKRLPLHLFNGKPTAPLPPQSAEEGLAYHRAKLAAAAGERHPLP